MSLSPLSFTGVSQFSADFQSILNRAVSIASLPVKTLQNQQQDLLSQKLLVSNLSSAVATLATTVSTLGSTAAQKALAASSSDTSIVTATNVNSASAAVYTLTNITSVARAAAETSLSGYANSTTAPVSSTGVVKLTVGNEDFTIDISSSNNLTSLRDTINSLGAGVTATVLTTGTGANPYYLSLTADTTGATTLELRDDPDGANTNLLTSLNQGANTEFQLNGVAVSKTTTYINDVVPGVTFTIGGTTAVDESVTVTIASNRSQLETALESFVSNYNILREQINAQVGSGAGLLSGDYLIREVQGRLRSLTSYSGNGSGSIAGLADLGIEFDQAGVASFNATTFEALSDSSLADAFDFLGSTQTGFGGLASTLTDISDAVTGMATIQIDKYDETERRLGEQITVMIERISDMQSSLNQKLQIADALLSSLESQQNVLDASIQSLNFSLYGKTE